MKKIGSLYIFTYIFLMLVLSISTSCTKTEDLPGLGTEDLPGLGSAGGTVTVTDIDGNLYNTVKIGTQVWMVENLKTTKYKDGTAIPNVTDDTAWAALTTPAYCWYNNDDSTHKATYGALYNWYTVNTGKLAPAGWHVATDAEWTTLLNYVFTANLGTSGSVGKALAATVNWSASTFAGAIGNDLYKNNRTGFSALPGAGRYGINGGFYDLGRSGSWWTATKFGTYSAWGRDMYYYDSDVSRYISAQTNGYSVRCLRD